MASYVDSTFDDLSKLANGSGPSDPLTRALATAQNKIIPAGGVNKKLTALDALDMQRNLSKFQLFVTTVSNLMKGFFDALKGVARNLLS